MGNGIEHGTLEKHKKDILCYTVVLYHGDVVVGGGTIC